MSDTTNNKTSILVSGQLPRFIAEEHETFVKFLEYYYKFLEQDGNVTYVSKNFMNFLNPDLIAEDIFKDSLYGEDHSSREDESYHTFLQKLYDTYIKLIPDSVLVDRVMLLKHAKEFYTARGTEKSIRFLIRALFDKDVDFYYPKKDILRASDGKWFIEKSLKINDVRVNNVSNTIAISNFANHKIVGLSTNAYATVERADSYFERGQQIIELKLSNINRTFVDGEKIFTFYTEEGEDKYLTANLFGGIIISVSITNGGNNYIEGTTVPVIPNNGDTGTGAQIVISKTSKGSIKSIGIVSGGAGFKSNDNILLIGGGGSGALGNVLSVLADGNTHPNSYNVISSTISLEANTAIGNAKYSNLVNTVTDPANSWISNSMYFWTFSNTGPLQTCFVISGGNNYTTQPDADVVSNTVIRSLGILGRMEIINGGFYYVVGDKIEFNNDIFSYGVGAQAKVSQVDANGTITRVSFVGLPGHFVGGSGYEQNKLPKANVISTNASAFGANVVVTAILGDGESLVESLSSIGTIQQLVILSGGVGYKNAPTINLSSLGDGTAQAYANIVTGVYTYPGRFINDDGMPSSYNFLEDRDYYQNFSYVVKTNESINNYRKYLRDLIHPAGMKLFGEYILDENANIANSVNLVILSANTSSIFKSLKNTYYVSGYREATYNVHNDSITISLTNHNVANSSNVYLSFISGDLSNTQNGIYTQSLVNANAFTVNTSSVLNANGMLRVYLSANNYNNVVFEREGHGYSNGDQIFVEFNSPVISNGIYTVYDVYNANTYNIKHSSITLSSNITMEGVATIGLYK